LDITARKKAERELDLERKKFQILTENSPFALAMIEQDGTFKYANPRFSELFGYDLADVPDGRTWFRKAYPEPAYRHEVIAAWKEDLRSAGPGKKRPRMYTVTCKDGSQKIVNFIPVHLHNGDHLMTFEDITERHLAEEALRESEELHSRILDTVPDLVYELSLEGKIIYANSAAKEILGYSPGALRQMNLADLLDEEGLAHALEVIREMVDSRKPSRTEYYRLRSAGGDFVPIETHAILMERSNQPPTIIGTARDITERQRAEEALRQAEEEKSLVLENMSEMVAYRDRNNRILWANRAAADCIGMNPEQLVGRVCYEVLHQRQTPCPDCRVFEAVATGQSMQTEVIKEDGTVLFVRSSPVRNEKGQVQGSVVVASDITDRKRAEKAIKDSEEKMRLVIESAPVGIRIIQHGRHIYVNPALVRMFGYRDAGEIIGWPVALGPLFAPDASVISPEKMAANPQGKEAPSSYEGLGLKEDGAWMEVQVWQTEIDYQGAPATLDFILDISEAKALRSQLLHAQKMEAIGTLAGGIAHDFNNILLPILINAEMVQEDLPLDSPLRQKMGRVIKACQRAIDLVKQILAFSRHEERGLSPVSLTATIEDSLRLLRSTLPATIEIRQHLECEGDTVLADLTQIQQVLINLCTNAAHAIGDRGGVIDISLKEVDAETARFSIPQNLEPGRWLQLTVKDNGPGMDPAIMERIFDPYFTTKKPEEGTGLGLAVVHGIVKKHGGVISVDSEPGKGSVFHIFLPRAEAEAITEDASLMPLPQGRERILLVDNDPEIVATLQQLMEQLGYQVTTQTDSIEALRCFRTRPDDFDLVITDQTMPKLTGVDLAREILDLRPEIPVILCTGFSGAVSREKARVMGIREFLIKPIANRVIAETIRRALKPKQDLS
jgi:PAS domain S-box-containing protein